jgi:hypothetical protein
MSQAKVSNPKQRCATSHKGTLHQVTWCQSNNFKPCQTTWCNS